MSKQKTSKLVEPHAQSLLEKKEQVRSSQAEYYDYMLRQAKLKTLSDSGDSFIPADQLKLLDRISDLEKLELKILARLSTMPDEDPYLLNYFSITKTRDRTSCAKKLADKAYRKQLMENAISALAPSSDTSTLINGRASSQAGSSTLNAFGF